MPIREQVNRLALLQLQFNKNCSKEERDTAAEERLTAKIRSARSFFQGAPAWQKRWPRLLIWKCEALRPYVEDGTCGRWIDTQTHFCAHFLRGINLVGAPGISMSGFEVTNWWLQNKVS